MNGPPLSPEVVLEQLLAGAGVRKVKTLLLLNDICDEQSKKVKKDFSLPTLGGLSAEKKGPGERAIRNRSGAAYRELISSWAKSVGTTTRKPAASKTPSFNNDLLEMIVDPSVRVLVGSILAENRKLKKEKTLLIKQCDVVIDCRKLPAQTPAHKDGLDEKPKLDLSRIEIESLKELFDSDFLVRMGWTIDPSTGRVKKGTQPIFRPGFATAINKIISACRNDCISMF